MPWQILFQKFCSMLLTNPNILFQQLNTRFSVSSKSFADLLLWSHLVAAEWSLSDEIHKAKAEFEEI